MRRIFIFALLTMFLGEVLRYTQNHNAICFAQEWVRRYNGPGNEDDRAYAIAVDGEYVYVTGESKGPGTYYDYATIKYSAAGAEENTRDKTQNPKLEVYPNPCFGKVVIKYWLPENSTLSLKLYDISGRLIKAITNEAKDPGDYSLNFDPRGLTPGFYFAKFEVNNYQVTKNLILLR